MKALVCLAVGALACQMNGNPGVPDSTPINKIQVIGSHNSYKRAIDPALFKVLMEKDSNRVKGLAYAHIPIEEQLKMGLNNLEIDCYRDEKGGKYAHPKGLDMVAGQAPYDPNGEMLKPGYKVFHIVDYDFRTDSYTFAGILTRLKNWSKEHPDHNPVFITLEAKGGSEESNTEKLDVKAMDDLDAELVKYLGKENIITPDDVRGKYATLEEAVLKDNWPMLQAAKGKYLFVLDDHGDKRATYMEGHPSLKGRILFVNAEPGTPEAAVLIRNDSKEPGIKELVQKGYIIRTRADGDTRQARVNDRSYFDAACNSGAQIITTDYYLKSTYFNSPYQVYFEGQNKYIRLNPVNNAEN
ncbi:hypothetical protein A4D02_18880 [Niastella koreensis]|uniref:Phosphoinositide phospholipase C, Ca2+-dependent n=2 Tax=Niastella koreensis TaxID=354356 RepID=G8T7Y1_NIAKG|nr:phosphatidylinositol-specific phospholipase C1-like protein [Niastella koreensis]AEV96919.1 hypothetical protein Niako_0524 [Niastella koreensis GR20-10]OQP39382.1 hypothetical protein A4D02_18880 [Niastella koreensis]